MATIVQPQPVVIVPDGLQADSHSGQAVPYPSFVYRAVLDYVHQNYTGHPIYLAPANHFGSGVTEQQAACNYLGALGVTAIAPPSIGNSYIDTRGNATQLRRYLEIGGQWPLGTVILVAAERHVRRAALCFRKSGFTLDRVEAIPYIIPRGERVVPRLWYYRHPVLHRLYEALAWVRDYLRP